MRRTHKLALAVGCAIILLTVAVVAGWTAARKTISQDNPYGSGPSVQDLQKQFSVELPAYIELTSFDVQAAANIGNEVDPLVRSRFAATVTLKCPTFVEVCRQADDEAWVKEELGVGDVKELFGTADSSILAGSWRTVFALEGDPLRAFGTPRSLIRATRVCLINPFDRTIGCDYFSCEEVDECH